MKLPRRDGTARDAIDFLHALWNARGFQVLAASAVAASVSATISEEVLASIRVPAGLIGKNGILRVTSLWTITNSANNKTLRVKLGGIGGTAFLASTQTTNASVQAMTVISNRNSEASQVSTTGGQASSFGASTGAVVTATIDTSAETLLVLTGEKASAGETITLERYIVEYYRQG